ncbi:hypothetical protein Vadar_021064 [Vaccinium darrowii]|uniref:Uncharacterized protein n=1 Tax=Vaccinium darrowii TaxID=229202 RepID=A0ACB7ZLV3_9ERIC|nr:hypothetical protein Vadar_021064 [Vaccinium darrowii]
MVVVTSTAVVGMVAVLAVSSKMKEATKAVEVGVLGIVVSNLGACPLDYSPATITVLEQTGQPIIYGLAAKGEYGVSRVIKMLKDELELTMALSGCPILKDITRSIVRTVQLFAVVLLMYKIDSDGENSIYYEVWQFKYWGKPGLPPRDQGEMAQEPVNVNEFQELARRALPKMYFDFYNGGAEDQHTLRENKEAFRRITMIAPQLKNFEGLLASDKGSNFEAFAAETLDPSVCWKDIEWLRSITSLPILIKGVLTAEDAIKAMEAGFAGIVVSNHGGRQLDYSPATITVLEEVVRAVGGKIPVLIDGGVRRGTDIFKALALGAQAVLIGRPVLYGLAAKGEYGVRRVIEMLKDELELTMALSGCPTLKDITRGHVRMDQDRLNCRL